jgi:hypothetical protein
MLGRWHCTCPAYQFSSRDARGCKHTQRLEEIMQESEDQAAEAAAQQPPQGEPDDETTALVESGHAQRVQALEDMAERSLDPDLSARHKLYWASFRTDTPAGAALLLRCATPDFKGDDVIGRELELYGVYAAPILIHKEATGEVMPCLRTVLVLWGGKTVGFVSQGMADSLADLMAGHGKGPWNPPLKVRLRQVPLQDAKRTYRLELVEDHAIDALFRVKGGGPPAPPAGQLGQRSGKGTKA